MSSSLSENRNRPSGSLRPKSNTAPVTPSLREATHSKAAADHDSTDSKEDSSDYNYSDYGNGTDVEIKEESDGSSNCSTTTTCQCLIVGVVILLVLVLGGTASGLFCYLKGYCGGGVEPGKDGTATKTPGGSSNSTTPARA